MEKINLKDLTEFQLLELRSKIQDELDQYSNRTKIKTYYLGTPDEGYYYLKKKNLIQNLFVLLEDTEDDYYFERIEIKIKYLNESEVKEYCQDYYL